MVTIIDVSKMAKVSVSTVSRVINGSAGVRDEPRSRVLRAIEELGYKPSYSARLLKTQKSYSVFILVPEIDNPYFTDIYHGARVTMEAQGYMAFLFEASEPEEVLRAIVNRGADGVVIDARYASEAEVLLTPAGIPFTSFNAPAQFGLPNSIRIDLYETLGRLCGVLYELGHERIGFISDRPTNEHPYDRMSAMERAAAAAGKSFDQSRIIVESDHENQFECGYRAFSRMMDLQSVPDAVIAINDLVAIGAMAAARKRGVAVPKDVSIVGFDNTPAGRYISPSLSSVNLPTGKQGELAAEMLLKIIKEKVSETYSVTLDTDIILRDSVRSKSVT
ncbi:MAG: LacI family DNA-binding transcriptional regulator [Spirochaetaceae bacterium]|nr:LacI family DNA-binding transcriptional regulator [Spirochaetaceae bacterium]